MRAAEEHIVFAQQILIELLVASTGEGGDEHLRTDVPPGRSARP